MTMSWKKMKCKYYDKASGKCLCGENSYKVKSYIVKSIQKYCEYDTSFAPESLCVHFEES